ncbi:T9SS type A sorting domain-containing protein [Hymenobacter sp. B81]|uniref:T9SS type A sorting domain-containing protein n=1 Tax=Hymenobacter sp. B81 TaxID=3344878 RepID=UPI0037DC3646
MAEIYLAPSWLRSPAALLTLLLTAGALGAHGQALNYTPATATNLAGSFTPLGAGAAAIAVGDVDDDNSAAQPIGFSFGFNGQSFTDFVLNTNGALKLGTAPPSSELDNFLSSSDPADVNMLLPFNNDLVGTNGSFWVQTTGTAPNRVCTIEWRDMTEYATPEQFTDFAFQVKLYETSNLVEFVYGSATPGTGGTELAYAYALGLKGSGSNTGQVVAVTKAQADTWAAATFLNTDYPDPFLQTFDYDLTTLADPGRTFRFTPGTATPILDAAVTQVYTLGSLPAGFGGPHGVVARVSNVGTDPLTNLPVTLSVTGANAFSNTQTIASLAVGASAVVRFAGYTPANVGSTTLTVTVPADATAGNNSQSADQDVTSNRLGYADAAAPSSSVRSLSNQGFVVNLHRIGQARTVENVRVTLGTDNASVGRTVYGVVLDAQGNVAGRSADYVIQAADLGQAKTFALTNPVPVAANTDFYPGLAQTTLTGGTGSYFPVAVQPEAPVRPDTVYYRFEAPGLANRRGSTAGRRLIEAEFRVVAATRSAALDHALSLYPNPVRDELTLELRALVAGPKPLQVTVTNMLGQPVLRTVTGNQPTTRLNVAGLAAGVYHVCLSDEHGQYTVRTISVQR